MFDYAINFKAIDNISKQIAKMDRNLLKSLEAVSKKLNLQFSNMNLKGQLNFSTEKNMKEIRAVQQKINNIGQGGRNLAGKCVQSLVFGAAVQAVADAIAEQQNKLAGFIEQAGKKTIKGTLTFEFIRPDSK